MGADCSQILPHFTNYVLLDSLSLSLSFCVCVCVCTVSMKAFDAGQWLAVLHASSTPVDAVSVAIGCRPSHHARPRHLNSCHALHAIPHAPSFAAH